MLQGVCRTFYEFIKIRIAVRIAFDLTELLNVAIILNICIYKRLVILFLRELNKCCLFGSRMSQWIATKAKRVLTVLLRIRLPTIIKT